MDSIPKKNGILTGQLECFCLVCDVSLSYDGAEAHCLLEEHELNMNMVPYYTLDGIKRFSKGYFCEICNLLIDNLVEAKIHVDSPLHAASKRAPYEDSCAKINLKVTQEGVIAFGCLKINAYAWNAIIDNTCVVCDDDVKNIPAHVAESLHVINLIRARVMRKYYCLYRKIDSTVQCLTCNKLIPENEFLVHIESPQHETVFKIACDGRIIKTAMTSYDFNNDLKLENFISKIDKNAPGGLCLLCDWFLSDSEFKTHPTHYHHQALLTSHNKWIQDKNNEKQFDLNNEFLFVDVKEMQGISSDESDSLHDSFRVKCNVDTKINKKTENVLNGELLNHDKLTTQSKAGSSKDTNGEIKQLAIDHDKVTQSMAGSSKDTNGEIKQLAIDHDKVTQSMAGSSKDTNGVIKQLAVDHDKVTTQSMAGSSKDTNGEIKQLAIDHDKVTTQSMAGSSKDTNEEIIRLAIEFGLKYRSEDRIDCERCFKMMRVSIDDIREHIKSDKHKIKFFKRKNIISKNYETSRMSDVLESCILFRYETKREMIVNNVICIKFSSYHVLVNEEKGVKCYLCNRFVNAEKHPEGNMHVRLLGNCLRITSVVNEFVREVNKGIYHCAYCNVIYRSWDAVLIHLMTRTHKRFRRAGEKSLVRHLSDIVLGDYTVCFQRLR